MTARLSMLLICMAALVAIAAGCGGDSSASEVTVTTSSLSKDEFIKQASAACTRLRKGLTDQTIAYLQRHVAKGANRADESESIAEMTKVLILPVVRSEIAAIQKLGAPPGDEDKIEAFLNSEQKGIDKAAKPKHIISRVELESHFAPSAKLGRAYGLDACVNSE